MGSQAFSSSRALPENVVPLFKRSEDRPAVLDLNTRWLDVRRIARKHPAYKQCLRAGLEQEDLDQEVMLRVLTRQQPGSASRYDPARACVSKYLTVVCGGILLNLLDQAVGTERSRKEVVGAFEPENGIPCDAALAAVAHDDGTVAHFSRSHRAGRRLHSDPSPERDGATGSTGARPWSLRMAA